jgi:NAD(P)H dehydrogenase (quinone)
MSKKVLIVYAHPDRASLTRQMADVAAETLEAEGHKVMTSDLCGMGWKAVFDAADFPSRLDPERLDFVRESFAAFTGGTQTADVVREQEKLLAADALILQFPLWWFSMPAILKGWIDRVWACGFAYNYQGQGNRLRYGEGVFAGKRALVSVTTGGPASDYAARGINGPIEELLFPLTHGTLFFPGFSVLPTYAVHGTSHITAEGVAAAKDGLRQRLTHLFEEAPIAFRPQNGGDYPDHHGLADTVAPGTSGIRAHIA